MNPTSEILTATPAPQPATDPVLDPIDPTPATGALAREPDALIALSKHEEGAGFTVEIVLRNVPPGQRLVLQSKSRTDSKRFLNQW